MEIALRSTTEADLDFVLALEQDTENRPFIGQWSRAEHQATIARADREHHIIELCAPPAPLGYLIAYNLVASGFGVFIKRVVVGDKSRGVGRLAVDQFATYAFRELTAPYVWLSVFGSNLRAQRAYAAVGFQVADISADRRRELHTAVGGFSDQSVVMMRKGR